MVTDLAEVYRLGTAKAKENLAFRRYLSARRWSEKRFQVVAADIQAHIDCRSCANCCRNATVSLSRFDVDKIASFFRITAEDAARRYMDPDPEAPALRNLRNSASGCIFLEQNLCTIYDVRPKACRDFPHIAVGSHTLGGRAASHDRWAAHCPIIFNALETYKHLTGYQQPGS